LILTERTYTSTKMFDRQPNSIEGKDFTIFCMAPCGVTDVHKFLNKSGISNTMGYISPYRWALVTKERPDYNHIAIVHDPELRQRHGQALRNLYAKQRGTLRVADFYRFYLHPYLAQLSYGDFSYILFEELEEFIGPTGFKYRDGGLLFPLNQETVNYNRMKECQKKLSIQDWKEQVLKLSLF